MHFSIIQFFILNQTGKFAFTLERQATLFPFLDANLHNFSLLSPMNPDPISGFSLFIAIYKGL